MIEITYYHPFIEPVEKQVQFIHKQLVIVNISSIKWIRNNPSTHQKKVLTNGSLVLVTPKTEMEIDGLGRILVKESKSEIKSKLSQLQQRMEC